MPIRTPKSAASYILQSTLSSKAIDSAHTNNMKVTSSLVAALASTALAFPIVERQSNPADVSAPALSAANSLADMLKGATDFAPKFLSGDSKGVANALEQMKGGAASFTPGFFNDLGKAVGGKPPAKRQAPAAAPGGLSSSNSLADMLNGAAQFSPKFLAGDSQGVATALAQMLGGAASFTPGFFSDLAKASQNGATAIPQAPKSSTKE
jgi:hypothetical protein